MARMGVALCMRRSPAPRARIRATRISAASDVSISADPWVAQLMAATPIRRPDEHTQRQRDIEYEMLWREIGEMESEDGWSSAAIAKVRREEERRGARRVVL